jgi:serine/threonine protein phosphatase 1
MGEAGLGRLHAPWIAPRDACIFAVGDIHGRDDLAALMLERIEEEGRVLIDAGRQPIAVFLGDYIDRGPQSRAVLDRLAHWAPPGVQRHFLRGNHEQSLMSFLDAPSAHRSWLSHGGAETMLSYDVRPPSLGADAQRLQFAADALRAAMGPAHLDFLHRLRDHLILGDYLFVHAGVDPRKGLSRQSPRDLLWIRARFLHQTALYDYCVVHGHTPAPAPYLDGRRIGVDTGAYATGKLSAARLEGVGVRFIKVEAHPERTPRPLDFNAVQF